MLNYPKFRNYLQYYITKQFDYLSSRTFNPNNTLGIEQEIQTL